MAIMRIWVFLLLFLSQTWAEEGALEMIDMKQQRGQDDSKTNITVDLWAELKELRDMVIEQKIELSNSKCKIEKLEEEKTMLDARVSTSESEVEELKKQIQESPKVAFSVGLEDAGHIGPFTTDITLKFRKVFTNVGLAYNTHAGVFTAPIRGVYYFRFRGYSYSSSHYVGFILYHNDKRVSWNYDFSDSSHESVSNGFVLELEKGDVVYLVLPASYVVYDDPDNHTVFSGFLIFHL